ncbi:hypothetical protein Tco_0435951 [Tanacetum coccineum]
MNPTPDPSKHDDPSVNRIHGFGVTCLACASVDGPSSYGLSAIKSAKTWPRIDVLGQGTLLALPWVLARLPLAVPLYIASCFRMPSPLLARLNSFYANRMSQEHSFFRTKRALFGIEFHVYSSQVVEGFFNVPEYFLFRVAFYYQVIYIYLEVATDLLFECFIHKTLVCCTSVLETERHLRIAEDPLDQKWKGLNVQRIWLIMTNVHQEKDLEQGPWKTEAKVRRTLL